NARSDHARPPSRSIRSLCLRTNPRGGGLAYDPYDAACGWTLDREAARELCRQHADDVQADRPRRGGARRRKSAGRRRATGAVDAESSGVGSSGADAVASTPASARDAGARGAESLPEIAGAAAGAVGVDVARRPGVGAELAPAGHAANGGIGA